MCRLFIIAGLFLAFRQLPPVGVAVDLVLQLLPERLRGRRLLGVRGDGVGHIRAVGGIDSVSLRRGQVYTLGRRGLYLGRVRRHDGRRNMLQIRAVRQNDRDCLRVAVDDSGNAVDHKRGNLRRVLDRCAGIVFKLRVDVDIARRHDERQFAFVDRNRCRTGRLEAVLERTCDQLLAVVRLDGQLDLFAGSSQVRGRRDRAAADVRDSDLVGAIRVRDLLNRDGERACRAVFCRYRKGLAVAVLV